MGIRENRITLDTGDETSFETFLFKELDAGRAGVDEILDAVELSQRMPSDEALALLAKLIGSRQPDITEA